MSRQEELNEVMSMINALTKKYHVSLGIMVNDLDAKEEVKEEPKVVEAEVV